MNPHACCSKHKPYKVGHPNVVTNEHATLSRLLHTIAGWRLQLGRYEGLVGCADYIGKKHTVKTKIINNKNIHERNINK